MPALVVLFCKIPISIPLKSETSIQYGAGTGYRCTALYACLMNSLIYCGTSRDRALSWSPPVNMFAQGRQPRQGMATYSRKSASNSKKRVKRQLTNDVLPIQEPKDPKTSETDAEIGPKRIKKLLPKGKQPQVLIPRADPFNVLGLSTSDEDSDTKSMRKSDTSKDFVNTPDTRALDGSDNESEVPVTDLKIDLKDEDVAEKHLVSDQDGQLPTSDIDNLDETQIPTEEILRVERSTSMVFILSI